MKVNFPRTCAATRRAGAWLCLSFLTIVFFSATTVAQTAPTPADDSKAIPTHTVSKEKKFLGDILDDQRAIWTAPFHWGRADAKWIAPLGLSTAMLIATDPHTSRALVEHGDNLTRLRISRDISRMGTVYATGGVAAAFYLSGRVTHNDHLRETGLLGAEALIDSGIVVTALKTASQRQRPPVDNSSGEFFDGGASFPSGHAVSAWSIATVVAEEYGNHRPLVKAGAYGLATAVSLARYTGRNHFLSDMLVGSAIGYGVGRYVYHKRHDPALDAKNGHADDDFTRSKLFPRITPIYNPHAHIYGGMLGWSF